MLQICQNSEVRELKAVYAVFNGTNPIIGNRQIGPVPVTSDNYSVTHDKAWFGAKHNLKKIHSGQLVNIIIEFQTLDDNSSSKVRALCWTMLNLFKMTDGSLNVGFWKIPLYDIPTNPTLPITNLGSLKLTSAYLCMRIALPGDNISQANGNSHPSEYKIPLPHQRGAAGMQNDRDFSFIPNKNVKPVKDPNYSANGIQIFLHYIRDYPSRSFNNIKVKCTLLQDGMPVSDENFTNMQWISKVFYSNDNLQQNKEGQQKMAEINADKEIGTTFTVLPILDSTVWKKDLYNMLWNNKLDSELVLVFDVMVDPDEFLSGRATLRMNNNDGTIKYGSYDLPVLSSDADQGRKQRLGYQLVCVINEPRTNELPKYPESRASKVSAPVKMNDNDDEEEEKIPKSKASKVSDLRGIAPSTATRDDDEPAFLPNSLKQYSEKRFSNSELIVFYIDCARFLPENVSITRVAFRIVNDVGTVVVKPNWSVCLYETSTAQKPVFGLRHEISVKKHPLLDPSALILMRIDTIDRVNMSQKVVGYSFFPLFVDRSTGYPAKNEKNADYALNSGLYQIPVFCQVPKIARPLTYEKISTLERIPCASLLIRIESAPLDGFGNPISVEGLPEDQMYDNGVVSIPPSYKENVYNTEYIDLSQDEIKIFKYKRQRVDPPMEDTLKTIKNMMINDKRFAKKLLKDTKRRRILDVTDKDFLNNVFVDVLKSPDDILDLNYFSQYISEIGFRFSCDMVYNLAPGCIYIAICSVNPPGAIYKPTPTNDKVVVYSEVDFSSFIGAQKFTETFYTFKNVPVDFRTHMIIDIKSIKLKKGGATEVKDFGWTIFPIFSTLDTDENKSTIEMFVRSGIFMIPLISGSVRNDIIEKIKEQNDTWKYVLDEHKRKISSISFMPKSSVVIRCIDNQREGHFKEVFDLKRIDYTYCPKKENYEYSEKAIKHLEKGQRISSLIPSDKEELDVLEEISALIKSVYKVSN